MAKTKKREIPVETPAAAPEPTVEEASTSEALAIEGGILESPDATSALAELLAPPAIEPDALGSYSLAEPTIEEAPEPITVMDPPTALAASLEPTPAELILEEVKRLRAEGRELYGLDINEAAIRYGLAPVMPACEALVRLSRSLPVEVTQDVTRPIRLGEADLTLPEVVQLLNTFEEGASSSAIVDALSQHKPGRVGRALIFSTLALQLATLEASAQQLLEAEREASERA